MEENLIENEINIVQAVKETINSLFSNLFSSISDTVFPLLDEIVFIHDDITKDSHFATIFGKNLSSRNDDFGKFSSYRICFILCYKAILFLSFRK